MKVCTREARMAKSSLSSCGDQGDNGSNAERQLRALSARFAEVQLQYRSVVSENEKLREMLATSAQAHNQSSKDCADASAFVRVRALTPPRAVPPMTDSTIGATGCGRVLSAGGPEGSPLTPKSVATSSTAGLERLAERLHVAQKQRAATTASGALDARVGSNREQSLVKPAQLLDQGLPFQTVRLQRGSPGSDQVVETWTSIINDIGGPVHCESDQSDPSLIEGPPCFAMRAAEVNGDQAFATASSSQLLVNPPASRQAFGASFTPCMPSVPGSFVERVGGLGLRVPSRGSLSPPFPAFNPATLADTSNVRMPPQHIAPVVVARVAPHAALTSTCGQRTEYSMVDGCDDIPIHQTTTITRSASAHLHPARPPELHSQAGRAQQRSLTPVRGLPTSFGDAHTSSSISMPAGRPHVPRGAWYSHGMQTAPTRSSSTPGLLAVPVDGSLRR